MQSLGRNARRWLRLRLLSTAAAARSTRKIELTPTPARDRMSMANTDRRQV
jgi:hypothetical protein